MSSSGFSAGVTLTDLSSDFLGPAQACVNPLFSAPPAAPAALSLSSAAAAAPLSLRLEVDDGAAAEAAGPAFTVAAPAARVTLNDCLACSGCVTSAEAVLVSTQSTGELLRALASARATPRARAAAVVVSVAPQALASLAAHFGIASSAACFARLASYLRALGAAAVIDTGVALDLALAEEGDELLRRLAETYGGGGSGGAGGAGSEGKGGGFAWAAPPATLPYSATHVVLPSRSGVAPLPPLLDPPVRNCGAMVSESLAAGPGGSDGGGGDDAGSAPKRLRPRLPVLCSACPGLVCYAEKAVPEAVPLLSRVKSPQQIAGALAKLLLATGGARLRATDSEGAAAAALGVGDVYHCAIMPCFDKKLEASRRDLSWASSGKALLDCVLGEDGWGASGAAGATRPHLASADELVREVDCVVTAVEIIDLLGSGELGDLDASLSGPVKKSAIDLATFPLDAAAHQQLGLLYSEGGVDAGCAEHASAGTAPLLEDLLSSLAPGGGAFCGDCESDGHLSFLFRHVARTLGGDSDGGGGVRLAAPAAPSRRRAAHDAPTAQASLHAPLSLAALLADPAAPLPLVAGRNADLREITLIVPRCALWALARAPAGAGGAGTAREGTGADEDVPLVFAAAYGFRNIQSVVARLRRAGSGAALAAQRGESNSEAEAAASAAPFAYVEVMACPSGCANGGGLARGNAEAARAEKDRDRGQGGRGGGESGGGGPPQTAVDAQRARVRLVAELAGGARRGAAPAPATTVARLLHACPLLGRARSVQGGAGWLWLLHTRYHALPPMEDGLVARW